MPVMGYHENKIKNHRPKEKSFYTKKKFFLFFLCTTLQLQIKPYIKSSLRKEVWCKKKIDPDVKQNTSYEKFQS